MFSKERIAQAATEIADHLRVVEQIKALQAAQKELADSIRLIGDRVREIQTELRALKAETLLEAVKETQNIVNAVQGGLNQRLEAIAVKVAVVANDLSDAKHIDGRLSQEAPISLRSRASGDGQ